MTWSSIFTPQSIMPIIIIIGMAWILFKSGGITGAKDSNKILRDLNEDLKKDKVAKEAKHQQEMAELRETHKKQIDALQTQITALQTQVTSLQSTKQALENTVNGRDMLTEIIKVLSPVPQLFEPGGVIEKFKNNQDKTLKELSDIKKGLNIKSDHEFIPHSNKKSSVNQ